MSEQLATTLVDKNGARGTILRVEHQSDEAGPQVVVQMDNGYKLLIPAQVLIERKDGSYFLPLSLRELGAADEAPAHNGNDMTVMPVIVEEIDVQRRTVEQGRVRVTKKVHEQEKVVDEPLTAEEVDVKRIKVDRVVDAPVPVRYVGDTMIVPLLEEMLVVEKRLVLKEELHITKRQVETHRPQQIILRSEEAIVDRFNAQGELRSEQ